MSDEPGTTLGALVSAALSPVLLVTGWAVAGAIAAGRLLPRAAGFVAVLLRLLAENAAHRAGARVAAADYQLVAT